MSSYMPQDVFNMCAVAAARYVDSEDTTIEGFATRVSDEYRKDYIDDEFEEDIVKAAHKVAGLMRSAFPGKSVSAALRQIQFCIRHYHPSGKKKSIFQGQFFNRQKTPLADRVSQCGANVMTFHFGTLSGTFPLAPKDWNL